MDVDENLRQNYIQFDPAPRKGNEVEKKRVPDYFLWLNKSSFVYKKYFNTLFFNFYKFVKLLHHDKIKIK